MILLLAFTTNFITVQLFQKQIVNLTNKTLVNQLKEIYKTASNQYQVYEFNKDHDACIEALEHAAKDTFEDMPGSIALAVEPNGNMLFEVICQNNKILSTNTFDKNTLNILNDSLAQNIQDGSVTFNTLQGQYFGVYKYHSDWNCYFIRAELREDTKRESYKVFIQVGIIIILLTVLFLAIGMIMFNKIFSNLKHITRAMYDMQQKEKLELLDLKDCSNDDITYLAACFNSLSSTIDNLLGIFKKFASKDVVQKAYEEHTIKVDGDDRELVMLFSDIKSFTFRTETLGNEIKYLLKVHYNNVIHLVHENSGVVGSIIGDAILAIFGTNAGHNKALSSLETAWAITHITQDLRNRLTSRRAIIEQGRKLTKVEIADFDAILIDVGVGIDGGTVFYGTIGSGEHMTSTVIGDRVNSASRLEGLTRIYKLPVIVSDYIMEEVEKETNRYIFYEIDTVQVKGKTQGKKIYFPFDTMQDWGFTQEQFEEYSQALALYYNGNWKEAVNKFEHCGLEAANEFLSRIKGQTAPSNWSGIWTMTTK